MRAALASLLLVAALSSGEATAQDELPEACRQNAQWTVDWSACLRASPQDAAWRPLVLINLGTEALMRFDYEGAIRYYDEAVPPGQQVFSDIVFHVYRGHAYWRVERNEEALRDAQLVYRMLHRDPTLHLPPERYLPPNLQADVMYAFILPVLKDLNAPEFERALQEFVALPAQDWVSFANRAAVMVEIGDAPRALELSNRALALAPNEPANLNNHCFIHLNLGRPQEALPYCERAVAAAPQIADIRHSTSAVYAALGRCAEAEREIAEARRLDPATLEFQRPIVCQAR